MQNNTKILKTSTAGRGAEKSTSLRADSLASLFHTPEAETERMTTVISGRNISGLLTKSDHLGLLVKTLMESSRWYNPVKLLKWEAKPLYFLKMKRFMKNTVNTLPESSETILKESDMKYNQYLFRLRLLERSTNATGFGFWATPNTFDHLPPRAADDCSKNQKNRKGRSRSGNLREQVIHLEMYPTPTLEDSKNNLSKSRLKRNTLCLSAIVQLIPTPTAADKEGTTGGRMRSSLRTYTRLYPTPLASERNYRVGGDSQQSKCLSGIARREAIELGEVQGHLNPDWEEWLMGYPVGYTDPRKKRVDLSYPGDEYASVCPRRLPNITRRKDWRNKRLESLGNAIHPYIAYEIYKAIDFVDTHFEPLNNLTHGNQNS